MMGMNTNSQWIDGLRDIVSGSLPSYSNFSHLAYGQKESHGPITLAEISLRGQTANPRRL